MTEKVNHPKHYNNHPSGVEAIDVIQYMNFCLGNAFKYVYRYKDKNGIEDLKKAVWYLEKQKTVMLKAHLAITHTATSDFYRILHHEPDTDIAKVLEIIYSVSFHDKPFKLLDEAVEILKKKLTNPE
jgi:hypothetical protein